MGRVYNRLKKLKPIRITKGNFTARTIIRFNKEIKNCQSWNSPRCLQAGVARLKSVFRLFCSDSYYHLKLNSTSTIQIFGWNPTDKFIKWKPAKR